jgi:hypothetical protein
VDAGGRPGGAVVVRDARWSVSSQPPPPPKPPWWRRGWGRGYLALLGFAGAYVLFTALLRRETPKGAAGHAGGENFEVGVAIGFFSLLLEAGVVVAISRREFWRVKAPALDFVFSLLLIAVCSFGVLGFCWVACSTAGVN